MGQLCLTYAGMREIVGLWSDQSSRTDAVMHFLFIFYLFFIYFFKTLLYLMDYFNTVLKRPSMIDIEISSIFRPLAANLIHNARSKVFNTKASIVVHSWQWDSHEIFDTAR